MTKPDITERLKAVCMDRPASFWTSIRADDLREAVAEIERLRKENEELKGRLFVHESPYAYRPML